MNYDPEYQAVILAGLLHDIGKFYGRSSKITRVKRHLKKEVGVSAKHPIVSAYFLENIKASLNSAGLDYDLVVTLVQRHHENEKNFPGDCLVQKIENENQRTLAHIVSKADNYSSSEREEIEYKGFSYRILMDSVFERLDIGSGIPNKKLKILPGILNPESAFPQEKEEADPATLDKLVASFGQEAKNIEADNFQTLFMNLLALIYKYCWSIPADVREKTKDVSLYDHLRTTSAIAACLYSYHTSIDSLNEVAIKDESKEKFLLIGGDLSGIQKYLYDISRIGSKGVAKRLRSRSFRIGLISEAASHLICQRLKLPLSCILTASGGRFTILAPNDNQSLESLRLIETEVDEWMLNEYCGELSLNLAWFSFTADDFKRERFGNVFENLNLKLETSKKQKFKSALSSDSSYLRELSYDKGVCKACDKFPGAHENSEENEEKYICEQCYADRELGRKLLDTKYLIYSKENGDCDLNFFNQVFVKLNRTVPQTDGAIYLVSSLSADQAILSGLPSSPKLIANYIPKNGGVLTFEEIAKKSEGAEYLGILKADVDNLGLLFSLGLKDAHTISRISSLSWMLDLFFSGYLPELVEKEYPDTYTVYAGGDDLLLIGPWDKMIDLAKAIRDKFKEFTAYNPNINISAGLAVTQNKTPMWMMAEAANEELEKSKKKKHIANNKNKQVKDRFTVFGATMRWEEVDEVNQWRDIVDKGTKDGFLSTAFIYRLLDFQKLYKDGNPIYRSRLSYQIARNIKDEEPADEIRRELLKLVTTEGGTLMEHLSYPVSYCLLKYRGKGARENE